MGVEARLLTFLLVTMMFLLVMYFVARSDRSDSVVHLSSSLHNRDEEEDDDGDR